MVGAMLAAPIGGCIGYQSGPGDHRWTTTYRGQFRGGAISLAGDKEQAVTAFDATFVSGRDFPVPVRGLWIASFDENGSIRWETGIEGHLDGQLCLTGDAVAVPRDDDSAIIFDLQNGGERGSFDAPHSGRISTTDDHIIVTDDHTIRIISSSGIERHVIDRPEPTTLTVAEGTAYALSDNSVDVIDPRTGEIIKLVDLAIEDAPIRSMVVHDKYVHLVTNQRPSRLVTHNVTDGTTMWDYRPGPIDRTLACEGPSIAFLTDDGVTILDRETGEQQAIDAGCDIPPGIADGIIYTGDTNDCEAVAYDRTGDERWRSPFQSQCHAETPIPHVFAETVIYGVGDATVGFRRRPGRRRSVL